MDGALQLLLIVDHIFDWARDIYRPAILRHLKFLSENKSDDALSQAADSDIFSMNRPAVSSMRSQFNYGNTATDDSADFRCSNDLDLGPFAVLDSLKGVLRDAALIEYKFRSFTMTGDNARTILHSYTPSQAIRFARTIFSWLEFHDGMILVDGETLDGLEKMWTSELRKKNPLAAKKKFYTRMAYKTWLTDEWVIVKEISCLAVTKDAIDVLTESSHRTRRTPWEPKGQAATQDCIIDLYQSFKNCSPDYNLRAAVMRLALSSYVKAAVFEGIVKSWGEDSEDGYWIPAPRWPDSHKLEAGNWFGLTKEMKGDPTHSLIDEIYKRHKIGRREPSESYLRISTNIEFQTLDEPKKPQCPQPFPLPGVRRLFCTSGNVLVIGVSPNRVLGTANFPEVCLFIRSRDKHKDKNPAALRSLVGIALERSLKEDRDILTTLRYAPNKSQASVKWNLKDTVSIGIGEHHMKIRAWLYLLRDQHGVDRFCPQTYPISPVESNKRFLAAEEELQASSRKRAKTKSPKPAEKMQCHPGIYQY